MNPATLANDAFFRAAAQGIIRLRPALRCLALLLLAAGILAPAQLQAKTPITIGGIYAVTGIAASSNSHPITGARLALQEINAAGGVMGRDLELQLFDNKSTPIGSSLAVKQAHAAGVIAIIGPSWSSHALAAAREAQQLRLPMIADVATNPAVTRIGDYIFRTCFTDVFQGAVLAHFARNTLKIERMLSMVDLNSDYSIGLEAIFRDFFAAKGGSVPHRVPYKDGELTSKGGMGRLVDQIAPLELDGLFIPGHKESERILQGLRQSGISAPAVGGDGWDAEAFPLAAGFEGQGAYYCAHWSAQWDTPRNTAFVERYGDSVDLTSGLALAYDTVYLLADAIERAGGTEPEALRKSLAKTRAFPGITGDISFDANGDPVKNAVIIQLQDGKGVYLKTIEPSEVSP